jgi:hypothetical protein
LPIAIDEQCNYDDRSIEGVKNIHIIVEPLFVDQAFSSTFFSAMELEVEQLNRRLGSLVYKERELLHGAQV